MIRPQSGSSTPIRGIFDGDRLSRRLVEHPRDLAAQQWRYAVRCGQLGPRWRRLKPGRVEFCQ
jgi:hypothetical protein